MRYRSVVKVIGVTAPQSPSVFITWAHANTDWDSDQTQEWESLVGQFATTLMTDCGIETEIDLWHQSEPVNWTQWGPQRIRHSDYVIVVTSKAWRERFDGENDPTVGAGAVAECNELHGIFANDQEQFRRKVFLVQLPGVQADTIPGRLHSVVRFPLDHITVAGLQPLVRYITNQPRYLKPTRGPMLELPVEEFTYFPGAGSAPSSPKSENTDAVVASSSTSAQSTYESSSREAYLTRSLNASDSRLRLRRRGVGLSDDEVERTLGLRPDVPAALTGLPAGEMRLLTAALGSGKSDVAEQWHQANIERASDDLLAAIPIWFSVDDLTVPLEQAVLDEIGRAELAKSGATIVIDGLDERTDRAASALRHSTEFLARWPLSRILLTSRATLASKDSEVIELGSISPAEGAAIASAVAGRPLRAAGIERSLLERPLFALLVGQSIHSGENPAGVAELIDRVVGRVVESDSFDLYAELKRLAVETIRNGGPIDPVMFTTEAAAAQIRKSPMVTVFGRMCGFSLATFEQWFASKALLEGEVQAADLLDSLVAFDRWKYVFANVLAAGEPSRVDPIMTTIATWNPGAAAWVVGETRDSGLARPRPVLRPGDWQGIGSRLRAATAAWLQGLGPLSQSFCMIAMGAAQTFDDTTIAVNVDRDRLTVAWLGTSEIPEEPLPPVLREAPLRADGEIGRTYVLRSGPLPIGVNWVWEKAQEYIAKDLEDRFRGIIDLTGMRTPGVAHDELAEDLHGRFGHPLLAEQPAPLYPGPDLPATPYEPFGSYSIDQMRARVTAILEAAMKCYLELARSVAPQFGRTLAMRGMMPVEFYGVMFHDPAGEPSPFDWNHSEPGLQWLIRPARVSPSRDGMEDASKVNLTVNDEQRSKEIDDDRDALYEEFRSYVDADPAYEPFAGNFSTISERINATQSRPATRLATSWLAEDLVQLGFLPDGFRIVSW